MEPIETLLRVQKLNKDIKDSLESIRNNAKCLSPSREVNNYVAITLEQLNRLQDLSNPQGHTEIKRAKSMLHLLLAEKSKQQLELISTAQNNKTHNGHAAIDQTLASPNYARSKSRSPVNNNNNEILMSHTDSRAFKCTPQPDNSNGRMQQHQCSSSSSNLYRIKYRKLKHEFSSLLNIAQKMENENRLLADEFNKLVQRNNILQEDSKIYRCQLDKTKHQNQQLVNLINAKELALAELQKIYKVTLTEEAKVSSAAIKNSQRLTDSSSLEYDRIIQQMKMEFGEQISRMGMKLEKKRIKNSKLERQIQRMKQQAMSNMETYGKDRERMQNLEKEVKEARTTIHKREEEASELRKELSQLKRSIDTLRIQNSSLLDKLDKQRRANLSLQKELMMSRKDNEQLFVDLEQKKTLLSSAEEALRLNESLKKENSHMKESLGQRNKLDRESTKYRVIGEIQDMIKAHKINMKG